MTWKPISLADLQSLLSRELAECTRVQQEFFRRSSITPSRWQLTPWGDDGGGFWAVARHETRVLWYNDIEAGFNVSRFELQGRIPSDEYWCNQDSLRRALPRLLGDSRPRTEFANPPADR